MLSLPLIAMMLAAPTFVAGETRDDTNYAQACSAGKPTAYPETLVKEGAIATYGFAGKPTENKQLADALQQLTDQGYVTRVRFRRNDRRNEQMIVGITRPPDRADWTEDQVNARLSAVCAVLAPTGLDLDYLYIRTPLSQSVLHYQAIRDEIEALEPNDSPTPEALDSLLRARWQEFRSWTGSSITRYHRIVTSSCGFVDEGMDYRYDCSVAIVGMAGEDPEYETEDFSVAWGNFVTRRKRELAFHPGSDVICMHCRRQEENSSLLKLDQSLPRIPDLAPIRR